MAGEEEGSDHPGQGTEGANSPQISHAQVREVAGNPALQDEEAKANDTVYPAQCYDLHCVARCPAGGWRAIACEQ